MAIEIMETETEGIIINEGVLREVLEAPLGLFYLFETKFGIGTSITSKLFINYLRRGGKKNKEWLEWLLNNKAYKILMGIKD